MQIRNARGIRRLLSSFQRSVVLDWRGFVQALGLGSPQEPAVARLSRLDWKHSDGHGRKDR